MYIECFKFSYIFAYIYNSLNCHYCRPQLTQLRELERSQKIFDETKGDKNKRKFIMKTIQTWFNDFDYDWSGENNHKLVYPHLLKLTRRLELATQLVIGQNKNCATEYQVCILVQNTPNTKKYF